MNGNLTPWTRITHHVSCITFYVFVLILGLLCLPSPAHADAPTDFAISWVADEDCGWSGASSRVAWGDVDGDGDLDLAAQCPNIGARLYQNEEGTLGVAPWWTADDCRGDLAWGDVEGDGDLDLAIVCGPDDTPRVYLNEDGMLGSPTPWNPATDGGPLAWGDMNGNGYLDLAAGPRVYANVDGVLQDTPVLALTYSQPHDVKSVAWGDMDHDGDLDLAVIWAPSGVNDRIQVYTNAGSGLVSSPAVDFDPYPLGSGNGGIGQIAWGDVNGDGYPELALSGDNWMFGGASVYKNTTGMITSTDPWISTEEYMGYSVAWGDADGDGDLDLTVGTSWNTPDRIYENLGGALSNTATWELTGKQQEYGLGVSGGLAWGDVDGDGDLDLAVGGPKRRVYSNESLPIQTTAVWTSAESEWTRSVAWGDVDGDGDLDLAASESNDDGREAGPTKVYLNTGATLGRTAAWESVVTDSVRSVAWGDVDGDGDLDLAVGNGSWITKPNRLYLNIGGTLEITPTWEAAGADYTWGVAWGDVDGDGDLDLASGDHFGTIKVYLNIGGTLEITPTWESAGADYNRSTRSVAWGDVDGDGDLDLAVGNWRYPNQVYLNIGGTLEDYPAWESADPSNTISVAWGDVDGDGYLDLAAGNNWGSNKVYLNTGGTLETTATWASADADYTRSVAWGDVDGDGDLDLAAGNEEQGGIKLYLNTEGTLGATAIWESADTDQNESIAWGDVDGDGDLDLAVGSGRWNGGPNKVYQNRWAAPRADTALVLSPALAPANFYAVSGIRTDQIPFTYTLFHPTGKPVSRVRAFYSPDGGGRWYPAVASDDTITQNLTTGPYPTATITNTHVFTWDVFSSGFFGQSDNVVLRLEARPTSCCDDIAGTYSYTNSIPGPYQRPYASATTFPFRVRGTQVRVLSGTVPISNALVYRLPEGQATGGFPLADSSGTPFRTDQHGYLQGRGEIGLGDGLFAMAPVHTALDYEGALAFDGVDDYAQIQDDDSIDFATDQSFTVELWAKLASEQQDIQLRDNSMLEKWSGGDGYPYVIRYFNRIAGSNLGKVVVARYDGANNPNIYSSRTINDGQFHHIAFVKDSDTLYLYIDGILEGTTQDTTSGDTTNSSPLFLGQRGPDTNRFMGFIDEVRIWNVARTESEIQADMYRRLSGSEWGLVGYWPFDDPDIADSGQCEDQSGDGNDGTLVGAEWVGDYLGGYTVYHTSGTPTEVGVDAFTVSEPGVQVLTVTAQHPLILFDIDVSLEWDAHNDPVYLQQLAFDLKKASVFLYDFADGQVALGKVTVHQNADNWAASHIVVQATNRLRPFAAIGGVVSDVISDTQYPAVPLTYGPGQVRMGSTWNRYGTPGQNIGVDWPLILGHELSHYFLYLFDVYLGLNENDLLVSWDDCTGSAMGDVYVWDNTEFISDTLHWNTHCADTLANRTLGRTEWETIHSWYPWLITPTVTNPGPYDMPFDFTTVTILSPTTEMDTLEDPMFYLDYEGQEVSSSGARAFLLRNGDDDLPVDANDFEYVYDLGSPTGGQNRLLARGAQPGDRLCVFDQPLAYYGCEVIARYDERLEMVRDESWTPVIQLSPVNSTTFGIRVEGLTASTLDMWARLYPEYGSAFTETKLYMIASGLYSGTLDLAYPAMNGHVQVWVSDASVPRREIIVGYSIGGNPGVDRAGGGVDRAGGGVDRAGGGVDRAGGGSLRAGEAPLVSPDGQMILYYTDEITFAKGEFYTIHSMIGLPSPPPGRTLVGQGYNLVATGLPTGTGVLTGSVSFRYLGVDVLAAGADEENLTIYFWDGNDWTELPTVLNTYFNMASAPNQGAGVYALMASVTIPLYGPGWNLVSYPVPGTQAVTEALRSISGTYTIIFGYVATDTVSPWRMYGVRVPRYINRLQKLRFGQGYWIRVTEPITWYIGGGSETHIASDMQSVQSIPSPPATYYGLVLAGRGFTPVVGMTVTAWIDGNPCGRGQTTEYGGEIVYSVHVFAGGSGGIAGCGIPDREVTFRVGQQAILPAAAWNDNQLWELALRPGWGVYLPLVLRGG